MNGKFLRNGPAALVVLALLQLVTFQGGALAATYEWGFESSFTPTVGAGTMTYAGAFTPTFGTTDGGSVPNIGGQTSGYLSVPAFANDTSYFLATFPSSGPNGGGSYINQYSMVFDIFVPGSLGYVPLFNSSTNNANDAEIYLSSDGSIGIAAQGYSPTTAWAANQWMRVAIVLDLTLGDARYYVNGINVFDRVNSGNAGVDGRFALYSNLDAGVDLALFNENYDSGKYTHAAYVSAFAFVDRALTGSEVAALGGASATGIFAVPEPGVPALGALVGLLVLAVRRRSRRCLS